jgi:hypothetical protein
MPSLPRCDHKSNQKRDPGFIKIRRGFCEHLPTLSGNAVKLYLWLQFKARWSGPRRGWVETDFEYMASGLGWSPKTLQRTIKELEVRPYIIVERARSQYDSTLIEIVKYDREETDSPALTGEPSSKSAVVKSDRTSLGGVDRGVDRGVDGFDRTSDRTSPPIQQSDKNLGCSKKVKEVKKEKNDAVRRPGDAELRIATNQRFSPKKRKQNLESRLMEQSLKNKNLFDGDLDRDQRAAFAVIGYTPRDPRKLAYGFVDAVEAMVDKHKGAEISPGNLCSKMLDYCVAQQKSCKKLGADPSAYYWPPDFQEHRDRLRIQELAREKSSSVRRSA